MNLRLELKKGITSGDVIPHFQPIVDLRSGGITGFEILARWNYASSGLISPGEFIPVAEEEGLIPLMTETLLRHALRFWQDLPAEATLSLNISPTQLQGNGLAGMIEAVAREVLFPLERLTLEVTESALLGNLDAALAALSPLKRAGCKLALDDFGTGYSSLTYLRSLPFDILKVDQSFVRTMATLREDRKIVGAVIGLGKSLGLKIVAEGIEERSQAEMLLNLGCEYGQGWFYGRPSAVAAVCPTVTPSPSAVPALSTPQRNKLARMEAMPAQSHAQLTAVYNAAPVGLVFFDCDFRFVNLNHRIASFHNLAIDEIVGRTLQEVDPTKFALAEPYLLRARSGEAIENVEFVLPTSPNGESVTHLVSFQPALDEVGEVVGVILAVTDISERKHIETALKESYDHYASMVELNPQIPWTMAADGSGLELSHRWTELTGIPVEQMCDYAWLDIVHLEDRLRVSQRTSASIKTGVAFDLEYRIRGKDHLWHWVRARGTPRRGANNEVLRWYGSIELVDEQRQALEEVKESHAHLQRVLNALPVGVIIAEAPSGKIICRNPRAQEILGQDPIEINRISDYSKRVAYYRDGTRLASVDFPLAKALSRGEATSPERIFYDSGDREGKWIDLSGAPLRNSDGQIIGAVAALQEITSSALVARSSFPAQVLGKTLERLEANHLQKRTSIALSR
ncbi:MAG: EAL domain-containing protein [Janthinobacterium lividum]